MTRQDGMEVRLSAGNWISLCALVLSIIGSVVGSVAYTTSKMATVAQDVAVIGATVSGHGQRITRLESVNDDRH